MASRVSLGLATKYTDTYQSHLRDIEIERRRHLLHTDARASACESVDMSVCGHLWHVLWPACERRQRGLEHLFEVVREHPVHHLSVLQRVPR